MYGVHLGMTRYIPVVLLSGKWLSWTRRILARFALRLDANEKKKCKRQRFSRVVKA